MDLLDEIICRCSTAHELAYAEDLLKSFAALQKHTSSIRLERPPEMTSLLEARLAGSEHKVADTYQSICNQLQSGAHTLLRTTQMLPAYRQLPFCRTCALPGIWKRHLCGTGSPL